MCEGSTTIHATGGVNGASVLAPRQSDLRAVLSGWAGQLGSIKCLASRMGVPANSLGAYLRGSPLHDGPNAESLVRLVRASDVPALSHQRLVSLFAARRFGLTPIGELPDVSAEEALVELRGGGIEMIRLAADLQGAIALHAAQRTMSFMQMQAIEAALAAPRRLSERLSLLLTAAYGSAMRVRRTA